MAWEVCCTLVELRQKEAGEMPRGEENVIDVAEICKAFYDRYIRATRLFKSLKGTTPSCRQTVG